MVTACGVALAMAIPVASGAAATRSSATSPIRHVVILYQENHSFNDLLGQLCISEGNRCAGSSTGQISDGRTIQLSAEGDIPPEAGHEPADQIAAINGGRMNGWDKVGQCDATHNYGCLTQVHAGRVPTLWSLADTYAISDMTFETAISASWGSHLELAAATMDWFTGQQPAQGGGCDSRSDTSWQGPGHPNPLQVPACVPDALGHGPYRTSPVAYVPTVMDTMDAAGLPWHIYAPGKHGGGGYGWAICPTFYECLGGPQHKRVRQPPDFADDARAGKLAALSIVIPYPSMSQHNGHSLMAGDDWIAKNVDAVMNGPDWSSTAIFVTYDDCGCLYDPVPPPAADGIRVPMVIVSPYARPRFVDHTTATLASMLAFVEQTFGLPALPGGSDGGAYAYAKAFNLAQAPLPPVPLPMHAVPRSSIRYIATHPPDPDDPT
jgi:phospholipase C